MNISDLKSLNFLPYLDDKKITLLNLYMNMTLEANEHINLTGNKSNDDFILKNILDSLLLVKYLKEDLTGKSFIDIGSGAGLPGIPLAIYYPESKFCLLEPIKKRSDFLANVAKVLDLKNVVVLNDRAENISKKNSTKFDFATARAVSNLSILLELAIPLIKVGGEFIAYKGKNYEGELNSLNSALNELNSSIKLVVNCELPYLNDSRSFIFIDKKSSTPTKYPRNYSLIKKKPL